MVKKWIIIGVIFALLVVGCTLEYRYVNGSFDKLYAQLQEYKPMLEESEENIATDENIQKIEAIHKKWHKKVDILKTLIWHTGLKDIEIGLSRILTYTQENDYTEAMTELDALIDYVKHYSDDFELNYSNFF